jgi:hypothetical protein
MLRCSANPIAAGRLRRAISGKHGAAWHARTMVLAGPDTGCGALPSFHLLLQEHSERPDFEQVRFRALPES